MEDKNSESNLTLIPGDRIKVYSKSVFSNLKDVTIAGVVKEPGNYKYKTGMTLEDILFEAGGVNANIYKYKIEIARINPDILSEEVYAESFIINEDNIEKYNLKSKNKNLDFKLMPYDYINVRPDPFFNKQKIITISGEVYYPGDYAILNPKETITSIIERLVD